MFKFDQALLWLIYTGEVFWQKRQQHCNAILPPILTLASLGGTTQIGLFLFCVASPKVRLWPGCKGFFCGHFSNKRFQCKDGFHTFILMSVVLGTFLFYLQSGLESESGTILI
jgi:hypothetical protein